MAHHRNGLAERRRTVGLTQEALAEHMRVDRSTITRWESGRTAPQPWMRPRLARLLRVDAEGLNNLLSPRTSHGAEGQDALAYATLHPERVDLLAVATLRTRFDDYAARYDRVPSAGLIAGAAAQLNRIDQLASASYRGRVQRELHALHADACTLMGQLIWDASQRRDHATATTYYEQSAGLARHLRDSTLEAHALLRTCYVALYGAHNARAGLALAEQAAEIAARTSPALSGLALLHVAEAHAMLGSNPACEHALSSAERRLGRVGTGDAAADLVSPTQFGRLAGSCYLSLGDHRRAESLLASTADKLRDRRKSRAIVLGNLTLARIRQRDVDAGVASLTEAIAELETTRGGGGMNIVFAAARELRPWRQEPLVAEVHDRLLGLMTAA
ncbi:helix-turn-helix transcriptional regulator [Streptomyces sp. PU10]|uniref:helix-turn-helix transcriptional regulator n=1 Tax=Streptomyces TaxID=1883 RepID=UPI001591DF0C|nr:MULTISPECIES: helix-turn-helix transcriptional regulator [unclassified Streptomyces]MDU0256239.1 helix-turn-helix transcriptional regulator [Streptomyces sp. PU10]QKW61120.1 helix-turn-helix transcriptional regulator [Streptomyces sp. NA03103]WSU01315.1 helix-turn-helix domain-containing protein [Streptomyces sp. NBC_01124]